jgi:hypothetical protein
VVLELEDATKLLPVADIVGELGCREDVEVMNIALVGPGGRKVVVVGENSSVPSSSLSCLTTKASGLAFLQFPSGSTLGMKRNYCIDVARLW